MAKADPPGRFDDPLIEAQKEQAGITDLMPDFWVEFGTVEQYEAKEDVQRWPFRQSQVTGKHARMLRDATRTRNNPNGTTHFQVMDQFFGDDADLDTFTALWFLARVQNGERVTYEECEDATSMAHFPRVDLEKADEEDPNSPEA